MESLFIIKLKLETYFRFFKSQWAMPMSKTFEFYDLFNYQILKIKESGVLNHIITTYQEKYGGINRPCDSFTRGKGSPLDLHTMAFLVVVILSGMGGSVVVFMLEVLWYNRRKYRGTEQEEKKYIEACNREQEQEEQNIIENTVMSKTSQLSVQSM